MKSNILSASLSARSLHHILTLALMLGGGVWTLVGCAPEESEETIKDLGGDVGGEAAGGMGGDIAGDAGGDTAGDVGGEAAGDVGGEAAGDMGGEAAGEAQPSNVSPDYALEMLDLVNAFRAEGGQCGAESLPSVPPLTLDMILNHAAREHAADMAAQDYFEHQSLDGRQPWDRMEDAGYVGVAFGENIAAGNESAFDTFTQWENSPGHCTNMLSRDFTQLGVGYVSSPFSEFSHYWVQNFATPR